MSRLEGLGPVDFEEYMTVCEGPCFAHACPVVFDGPARQVLLVDPEAYLYDARKKRRLSMEAMFGAVWEFILAANRRVPGTFDGDWEIKPMLYKAIQGDDTACVSWSAYLVYGYACAKDRKKYLSFINDRENRAVVEDRTKRFMQKTAVLLERLMLPK
jgi:hypothetical protein